MQGTEKAETSHKISHHCALQPRIMDEVSSEVCFTYWGAFKLGNISISCFRQLYSLYHISMEPCITNTQVVGLFTLSNSKTETSYIISLFVWNSSYYICKYITLRQRSLSFSGSIPMIPEEGMDHRPITFTYSSPNTFLITPILRNLSIVSLCASIIALIFCFALYLFKLCFPLLQASRRDIIYSFWGH